MTTRRGFLAGMLALGAAPAIVRAASLMPVVTPAGLVVPSGDVLTLEAIRRAAAHIRSYNILDDDDLDEIARQCGERIALKRDMLIAGVLLRG